jgi:hypothetical protein
LTTVVDSDRATGEARRVDDHDNPELVAARAGVELDAVEASQWMLAVAAGGGAESVGIDDHTGVFGHRVALLDFDGDDLERIRRLIPHVRLVAHPQVESAIAISGSSAQGRVQLFPGDADFFERAHIHAASEAEAQQVLRDVMRATAMRAFAEPDIVLVEVNLGAHDTGPPITWTPDDLVSGTIAVQTVSGGTRKAAWDDVDVGAGWVYLGWIVADRVEGRIALASVMVDATWERPDGTIASLDGAIDPLAQEIYLEPEALPLVQRLSSFVAPDAGEAYRVAMRGEAYHYTAVEPNFAKAAKRLYNLFRVADELEAAAYVRELFDEPTARLYQVPGLLEAADVALHPDSGIERGTVLRQLEVVETAIADVIDGAEERRLLEELDRLRTSVLTDGDDPKQWEAVVADVRGRCATIVNDFFRERLFASDRVREFVRSLAIDPPH